MTCSPVTCLTHGSFGDLPDLDLGVTYEVRIDVVCATAQCHWTAIFFTQQLVF